MMLRTHTQTGGSTLTAQQPENNIVRAGDPGARRGARRRAVDGALVLRRGARDPDREGAEDRRPHPADRRRGDRRHRHDRPDGGLLLRRVAHERARAARDRGDGQDRGDGRRRRGDRLRLLPQGDPRRGLQVGAGCQRGRACRRRRQQVPRRRRASARVLPGRPVARRAPARKAREAARRARQRRRRAGAGRTTDRRRG